MNFERLVGQQVLEVINELAQLRIEVFREYPYLYDGDLDYEVTYLKNLADSPRSLLVVARDGGRVVGGSTGLPLVDAAPEFQEPFEHPQEYFYFGESVLQGSHRGHGAGHRFFDEREDYARGLGFEKACFCAVVRDGTPPQDYRPLEPFWQRRGYRAVQGMTTEFPWKDLGEAEETLKLMQFWTKDNL